MRLETLIGEITEEMYKKILENHEADPQEARKTAQIVGLAAIKYGDLSNQASKDYVFDVDRFTSFEGNTGPYILYTIVRIKSILAKYREMGNEVGDGEILAPAGETEKALALSLCGFNSAFPRPMRRRRPIRSVPTSTSCPMPSTVSITRRRF